MRLLIAGGGTGGHIYPALAVARSLRARSETEVRWLGGHRGLERELVGAAGIPFQRLLLRPPRTTQPGGPLLPRPGPPRAGLAPGSAEPLPPPPAADLSTR